MTETDKSAPRTRSGAASYSLSGMRAAMAEREWHWRLAGLILAAVIAVAIASMTLTPATPRINVSGIDKIYHFIAFGSLIFPLIVTDSRRWAWAVPLVIGYGGAIELIQPTVGRSAEWLDFGANTAGVLAGAALAEILHDRIRASVFDSDPRVDDVGDETEEERLDAMRADLMDELRVVLREELASYSRPGRDDNVGPSPAEMAAPKAEDRKPPARLPH